MGRESGGGNTRRRPHNNAGWEQVCKRPRVRSEEREQISGTYDFKNKVHHVDTYRSTRAVRDVSGNGAGTCLSLLTIPS